MFKWLSVIFLSNLFAISFTFASQQEDQELCVQQFVTQCISKCDQSKMSNCSALCQQDAQNQCLYAGE